MQRPPTSPKRSKRGHAAIDAPDLTPVAKQHPSDREGGDIDLGMLDQEAFARVIASGQQQQHQNHPAPIEGPKDGEEEEEDEPEGVDDVTYHPSGLEESSDPIYNLRMACLPVLDIFVLLPPLVYLLMIEFGTVKDIVFASTFDDSSDCHWNSCISV